ncbi:hypothetical protein KKB10_00245 [Patescibacteria group bacterium]|nr:hypothetical protein [Patescibacteria group bacterium]
MLGHFKLNAKDMIFFRNKKKVVKSARFIGINTFYYNKDKRDLVKLKKFLDEGLV